jgi:hypothetical protein
MGDQNRPSHALQHMHILVPLYVIHALIQPTTQLQHDRLRVGTTHNPDDKF